MAYVTNVFGQEFTVDQYRSFIFDSDNSHNCDECPNNGGFDTWPGDRLPCGQFHCWVDIHCRREED